MDQFLGNHQNKLDSKNRVSIPAPFRQALKKLAGGQDAPTVSVILRPSHQYPCIEVWPEQYFLALSAQLDALPEFSVERQDLATTLYGDAFPVESDKEGRIVLPENLIAYATLSDGADIMGQGKTFQIWEPAAGARRRSEARVNAAARQLPLPATR